MLLTAHDDEIPLIEDSQITTEPPSQGFIITTTSAPSQSTECLHNNVHYIDGELIETDQACEHCYCMRGDIVCAVQECGRPIEMHGTNCIARLPKEGECCPQIYECENGAKNSTHTENIFDSTTSAIYKDFITTTESITDSTARLSDMTNSAGITTERFDDSENEIHDKDYDHFTIKPSWNISSQVIPGTIDYRINNEESTTILNDLKEFVTSTVVAGSSTLSHDEIIPTIVPHIHEVTEKLDSTEEYFERVSFSTESKIVPDIDLTTTESALGLTTMLSKVEGGDEYSEIPNIDGSLLSNVIPGEGDCLDNGITYSNSSEVPVRSICEQSCYCYNSIVHCENIQCPPSNEKCEIVANHDGCCPVYNCENNEGFTERPSKHDDEYVESTTLSQKSESHTESENDSSTTETNIIVGITSSSIIQSPISSKLDDSFEMESEHTTVSGNENIESEATTSSKIHDNFINESNQTEEMKLTNEQESTTRFEINSGQNIVPKPPKIPEIPQMTTENSDDDTTIPGQYVENESEPVEHHSSHEQSITNKVEEYTTKRSDNNEYTTYQTEITSLDELITTQKQTSVFELSEPNGKLPIESTSEHVTTVENSDIVTKTAQQERNEGDLMPSVGTIIRNEIHDSSTQMIHKEISINQVDDEKVLGGQMIEATTEILTDYYAEKTDTNYETVMTEKTLDSNKIPSEENKLSLNVNTGSKAESSTSVQQDVDHTPPPVAIERDESITESFNQELPSTFATTESASSTELSNGKDSVGFEDTNESTNHNQNTSHIPQYNQEEEATTHSPKIELGEIDSSNLIGDVSDESESYTTEESVEIISMDSYQKPTSVQNDNIEFTTHQSVSTETPLQPDGLYDEYSTPNIYTNKLSEEIRTPIAVLSEPEDLDNKTEKAVASKLEDLEITSQLTNEDTNSFSATTIQALNMGEKDFTTESISRSTLNQYEYDTATDMKKKIIPSTIEPFSTENDLESISTTISFVEEEPIAVSHGLGTTIANSEQSKATELTTEFEMESLNRVHLTETIQQIPHDSSSAADQTSQPTENAFMSTTAQDFSITDRIGEHEIQQEGFTTEKSLEFQLSSTESIREENGATTGHPSESFSTELNNYDITTLLSKIHDERIEMSETITHENATIKQELQVTTREPEQMFSEHTSQKIEKDASYTTKRVEIAQENEVFDESTTPNAESEGVPSGIPQQHLEFMESTAIISNQTVNYDEQSTNDLYSEAPTTHTMLHDDVLSTPVIPSVELSFGSVFTTTVRNLDDLITTENVDNIKIESTPLFQSETYDQENGFESSTADMNTQQNIPTTMQPIKISNEPSVSVDEESNIDFTQRNYTEVSTKPAILDSTTIKSVVELLTTLHPTVQQEIESINVATDHPIHSSSTPSRFEIHDDTSTSVPDYYTYNRTNLDPSYNGNKIIDDAAGTKRPSIPPESANNIPLIRDPVPNHFDDITTKLAESFDTTTLPSTFFSHTENISDSTTIKNTQNEITESSHISENSMPNETEQEIEQKPNLPINSPSQASSYDQSGYGNVPSQYPDEEYTDEDEPAVFGPGTCRYGGKLYVSAQQIPRDDPCDFCFCFRSDIICLQQSCPPPINGCHEEPIQGFCCPRYECPVSMALVLNSTTTTTTTLPPYLSHFQRNSSKVTRSGCQVQGITYNIGERVTSASGPCIDCMLVPILSIFQTSQNVLSFER